MINHSPESEHYPDGYQFPLPDRAGDKPVKSLLDDFVDNLDPEESPYRMYDRIAEENLYARIEQGRNIRADRRRIRDARQARRQGDSREPYNRSAARIAQSRQ